MNTEVEQIRWEVILSKGESFPVEYVVDDQEGDFDLSDPRQKERAKKFVDSFERVVLVSNGNLEAVVDGSYETIYYGDPQTPFTEEELERIEKAFPRD